MCKNKSSTRVIDPKKTTTRLVSGPSDPSTSTTTGIFTGSSYQSSSVSSHASLATARESLPENTQIYDFSEIRAATDNFLSKKYSSSASASTWRCSIRGNDMAVIQRKLRRKKINIEQLKEKLSSICKGHHASIIKLRGTSISGNYMYLVYDYVHGASLSDCLRNSKNPGFTVLGSWMSRVQIASDIAHGLDYIHNYTGLGSSFVHNHIKSSSIVVTELGLKARICHFGTAELCGEVVKESDSETREVKFEGTRGYMSPEFQNTGIASQKSDVYAFGVVILELLSGEEPLSYTFDDGGYRRISLVETAREGGGGVRLRRWIDKRLKDSYPVEVAEKMVRIALDCVEDDPDMRPDMGRVVGRISKVYLDSKSWADTMGGSIDLSVSLAPR